MNRKIYALLSGVSACFLLFVAGCTDLTVEPKSTVTAGNAFNDPNSYRAFLAKLYVGLAATGQQGGAGQPDLDPSFDEGFSQYIRLWWQMNELPTDEAIIAWNDGSLSELNSGVWGPANGFLGAMYHRVYFQVMQANEFLRQTTDAKLDSRGVTGTLRTDIATYRAEARFLRALSYWHGIDLFGSIPLVTEADPVGGTAPQQATRTDIYNFIVSELTAIQGALPGPGASTYGRATGPAASMLLAKLYLNAGVYTGAPNYAGARLAASAVIADPAFSIDPDYADIFKADNHTSPEIVFPIPSDGLRTQSYGNTTFLTHAACGGSMNYATYGIDGCWWGLRLKPEAYNRYAGGDGRAAFFYTAGQTGPAVANMFNFTDGYANPKFTNITSGGAPGSHSGFADTDFPMFRLADAYLIYAEAVLRGGGGTQVQALTYVNDLRIRAYGDSSGVLADTTLLTLDFILDERGRELLWEGHRRTDLIRFGRFTGATYIWAWKGGVVAGSSTGAHLSLYPLPASELVANPNLTQNPGY